MRGLATANILHGRSRAEARSAAGLGLCDGFSHAHPLTCPQSFRGARATSVVCKGTQAFESFAKALLKDKQKYMGDNDGQL